MSSQENQMGLFVHVVLFCVLVFAFENARAKPPQAAAASSQLSRSLYSFGDSFVDPGNNDYIPTNATSNFPPYGNDFPGKIATGRFSNGLLFPDLLAKYLGAPTYQLPYLEQRKFVHMELVTAVSFASATSGFDPSTANKTKAIQMWQQLQYFKEYKAKLQKEIGSEQAQQQIKEAVFYINAGSEDFVLNYFQDGNGRQTSIPLPEYERLLLNLTQGFIQGLWVEGARRFAVNGLPPLGCIPIGITNLPPNPKDLQAVSNGERKCLGYVNDVSEEFNSLLQKKLVDLQSKLSETKIAYIDFEESLLDAIQNPNDFGFSEVNKGCCGTGLTEIGIYCNETTPICNDSSKYVFWDAAHPTEKTYKIIFTSNLPAIEAIIGN